MGLHWRWAQEVLCFRECVQVTFTYAKSYTLLTVLFHFDLLTPQSGALCLLFSQCGISTFHTDGLCLESSGTLSLQQSYNPDILNSILC